MSYVDPRRFCRFYCVLPRHPGPNVNADQLGPWSPLPVAAVHEVFRSAPFRWFIAGGHALELALGRSWRSHDDLDVGVCRKDLALLHRHLSDWVQVAARGALSRWDGRLLSEDRGENNIWARRGAAHPWAFDIVVSGGDEDAWWSRRDPRSDCRGRTPSSAAPARPTSRHMPSC